MLKMVEGATSRMASAHVVDAGALFRTRAMAFEVSGSPRHWISCCSAVDPREIDTVATTAVMVDGSCNPTLSNVGTAHPSRPDSGPAMVEIRQFDQRGLVGSADPVGGERLA